MNNYLGDFDVFQNRSNFVVDTENGLIIHKNPEYAFLLRPGGYIPKSGIFLVDYFLKNNQQKFSKSLEVGVGETAFIAINLVENGITKNIDSVDIDPIALKWANKNIKANGAEKHISLYKNLDELQRRKYDLIYSNPPQLPVPINTSLHNDGGLDGLDVVNQIINFSQNNLIKNGRLVLLLFDFLNIEKSYNKKESLLNILANKGFHATCNEKIVRIVRPGGKMEKNLKWIQKQYPLYNFKKNNEFLGYYFIIIEAIKK